MGVVGHVGPPGLGSVGHSSQPLSDRERTKFQSFNLVPTLMAARERRPGGGVRDDARDALSVVGLAERADHRLMELSGGEQQRVAVA